MICTRCGHDSKHKDRPNRVCPACAKTFAFEPQQGDPFTDPAFANAIDTISGSGSLRWGVEHLYWELARRRNKKQRGGRLGCLIAGVVGAIVSVFASATGLRYAWIVGTALLLAAGWRLIANYSGSAARDLPLHDFNRLWERWIKNYERPQTAIKRLKRKERAAPPPDLHDYSFDRVVVCDCARTVDLLLANNFHFENNCAVLSIAGYPDQVFEPVRAMLKKNPRLEIFALHDATPFGCRIAHRLATDPKWFKGQGRVIDVGLRPRHVKKARHFWLTSEVSAVEPARGVSKQEAAWLSRFRMEVAVYRPESVLRALFRAINRQTAMVVPDRPGDDHYYDDYDDSGDLSDSFG